MVAANVRQPDPADAGASLHYSFSYSTIRQRLM